MVCRKPGDILLGVEHPPAELRARVSQELCNGAGGIFWHAMLFVLFDSLANPLQPLAVALLLSQLECHPRAVEARIKCQYEDVDSLLS